MYCSKSGEGECNISKYFSFPFFFLYPIIQNIFRLCVFEVLLCFAFCLCLLLSPGKLYACNAPFSAKNSEKSLTQLPLYHLKLAVIGVNCVWLSKSKMDWVWL